jgi:hypothetical protein
MEWVDALPISQHAGKVKFIMSIIEFDLIEINYLTNLISKSNHAGLM